MEEHNAFEAQCKLLGKFKQEHWQVYSMVGDSSSPFSPNLSNMINIGDNDDRWSQVKKPESSTLQSVFKGSELLQKAHNITEDERITGLLLPMR
ncbi:hypothetical protein VNO78_10828 [Psophocarpus tetragonolobus]|uniref:Uncharacterized protein n=1 Tax=Psophocarpus tetragonolobus TaxID=3891 RepID=A0AAN9XMW1_PSOTE